MTREETIALTIRFVGVLLFAIGIGAGVVGGYATFQQSAGLCGQPMLEVNAPGGPTGTPSGAYPTLSPSDLSPAERTAFVEAIESPADEAKIEGEIETPALRNGAVVTYRGERYFAAVGSLNRCVSVDPLVFALGASLVALGGVVFAGPTVWRRVESFLRES